MSSILGFFLFHMQSAMYSSQSPRERERDEEGGGGGEIGETHVFNKNYRFFRKIFQITR